MFDFVVLTLDEVEGKEEDLWGEWHVRARELHRAIEAVMTQPLRGKRHLILGVPKELYIILDSSLFVSADPSGSRLVAVALWGTGESGPGFKVLTRPAELPSVPSPITRMTEEQPGYSRSLTVPQRR